ncbi:MAG TPA: hypothetical protein VI488_05255 [Candidatus Angelobacter sp.]
MLRRTSVVIASLITMAPPFLAGQKTTRQPAQELAAGVYLEPKLQTGQALGNVFSRTISYRPEGTGIDELVRRASGTGIYVVTENSSSHLVMDGTFRYDGRPEYKGKTEMKDRGRTICYDGNCSPATDASGPLYNPLLWGEPKGTIRKGMSWNVAIAEPWELGPPGQQTVTVIDVDPAGHSVTLKREGSGDGYFADDKKQIQVSKDGKSYLVDVAPGRSHWVGYTRFREGVVISDELVVERPVTLTSKELGSLPALERQYILLNASPAP